MAHKSKTKAQLIAELQASHRLIETLRESEKRSRDLFENSPDAIFVEDRYGYVLDANPAACALHGMTRSELLGISVLELVPPWLREVVAEAFKTRQISQPEYIESFSWTKDEQAVPVEISTTPIEYLGQPAILLHVRDITKRKQDEAMLQIQNEYLVALHETTLGLISRFELNDLLITIVKRVAQLVGTSHGAIYLLDEETEAMVSRVGIGLYERYLGYRVMFGAGMTGQIWQTGQPLIVTNYDTWQGRIDGHEEGVLGSVMGIPLTHADVNYNQSRVIGVLAVAHEPNSGRQFVSTELELLNRFGQLASLAIDNAHLFQQAQQRAQEMATLAEIGRELSSTLDLAVVLERIVHLVKELLRSSTIALYLQQSEQPTQFQAIVALGEEAEGIKGHTVEVGRGVLGNIVQTGRAEFVNYLDQDPRTVIIPNTSADLSHALAGIPLISRGETLGILAVWRARTEGLFTEMDLAFLMGLARQATIALDNARLFQQIQSELSKRQQIEADSVANERKYRDLVETANSVILEWDNQGRITFMNEFGLGFFGYTAAELIGQNVMGTIVPLTETSGRDLQFLMADVVVHPKLYEHNENENITKDGRRVWCVWSNTPQFDLEGNFIGLLSIANDITVQKLAEQAIHRQNEFLAALHETTLRLLRRLEIHDLLEDIIRRAAQLFDTEHGSIYFVDAAQQHLELKVGIGLFAAKMGTQLALGESMPGQVWQHRQPMFVNDYATWTERSANFDYNYLRAGIGVPLTHVAVEGHVAPIMGVLGLAYDVNSVQVWDEAAVVLLSRFAQLASIALDNARLYEEAQTARHEAEAANEAKSVFLANVSHELRTPLTSVLGFAKIIAKRLDVIFPLVTAPNAKAQRAMTQVQQNVEIIIAEGERLTALINDVLDLAKIESGKIEWHMQPLDLAEVMQRAATTTASLFIHKNVPLLIEIQSPLPQVIGDQDRLLQVMINLISNASKFTEFGSITCRAKPSGSEVIVSVSDTGIGIAPQDQDKVFDKFRQVGNTLTDKPQGTGLGLPICKEIIHSHQGQIWLDSELGRGTTVSFSLPIIASAISSNAVTEAWVKKLDIDLLLEQFGLQQNLHQMALGDKKTVLVVDDDANIRQMLVQELEAKGYQVLEAKDGLDALTQVQQHHPDLLTLDVMMPKMNGFDVAALLKNDPMTANIPIILLTIVEDEPRGYRLGVDRYFKKPIDMPKLIMEIEALIAQGGSRKSVLIVDQSPTSEQPLIQIFQAQGYSVAQLSANESLMQTALVLKPDMVIINSDHPEQYYDSIRTLRYESGFENIMFFFFQESH